MGFDDLFEPARELEDASKSNDDTAASGILAHLRQLCHRIEDGAVIRAPVEEVTP